MKNNWARQLLSKSSVTNLFLVIFVVVAARVITTRGSRHEMGASVKTYPIHNSPIGIVPILPVTRDPARTDGLSDEVICRCFLRLLPPDELTRSGTLHALRLWGVADTTSQWSGESALAKILNTAPDPSWSEPLVNGYGVFVVTSTDESARRALGAENLDPHRNKTLSVLALCDVDASESVRVGNTTYTVRDLIRGAMNESRMHHGVELPWTIIALASYLASPHPWLNRHSQQITLESLVLALLESPPENAPCLGTHTPYAATFVLRAHLQTPMLSPSGETRVRAYLLQTAELLRSRQRPSGSWGKDWNLELAGVPGVVDVPVEILVTGHHLEWLSLLPPDLSPSREMLHQAERAIVSAILSASDAEISKNYTVYSHAGCALRNRFPAAWQSMRKSLRTPSNS